MQNFLSRAVRFASNFKFDLVLSSKSIPKNKSNSPWGQDSMLLCEVDSHETLYLGVFDGVGGFEEAGIDSSEFSNSLMKECKEVIRTSVLSDLTAKELLSEAYNRSCRKVKGGGSTACVALFDREEGVMDCYNIGDSGLTLLRFDDEEEMWRVHEKTSHQTHSFNFPYQLVVPKNAGGDPVSSGNQYHFEDVQDNDIILLSTDGLTDNVFDEEIIDLLKEEGMTEIKDFVDQVSTKLVCQAYEFAVDPSKETPFSQELGLAEMGSRDVKGGKLDDITIIMGYVIER